MTRDEILNMPAGREMDAMIAEKVMELCVHNWTIFQYNEYEGGTCKKCEKCNIEFWGLNPPIYGKNYDSYSTNISAAWELVEKFGMTITQKDLSKFPERYKSSRWLVDKELRDKGEFWLAFADTAPLAICRAALLAVMEEK